MCILAALLAGMLVAAFSSSGTSPFTAAADIIYKPFQQAAAYIAEKTSDWKASFVSSSVYKDQIAELESEIDEYNEALADYERTKQKLQAYEEFLQVKEDNPDFEFISASVVSRNTSDIYDSFTLDKGSVNGVEVDNPVIYGSCVVGIVKEVGTATCVVKTILDPSLNISVYEIKSRENGYSTTTAALSYEGLCKMSGLSKDTAVAPGGIVCTSGLGGIFPRNLIVGTVTELQNETADVSLYAVIEPGADVNTVNDVLIITAFASDSEDSTE